MPAGKMLFEYQPERIYRLRGWIQCNILDAHPGWLEEIWIPKRQNWKHLRRI
ncbi:MAG: hypothetical protein AAFY26_15340 [Cyanobacteria bacterium J06638_22]